MFLSPSRSLKWHACRYLSQKIETVNIRVRRRLRLNIFISSSMKVNSGLWGVPVDSETCFWF